MKKLIIIALAFTFISCSGSKEPAAFENISAERAQIPCGNTGRLYYSNGVNAYCQHPSKNAPNKDMPLSCSLFVGAPSKRFGNWCDDGKGCKANMTLKECRKLVYGE